MSSADTPESRYPEFDHPALLASAKDAVKATLKLRTLIRSQYQAGFMSEENYREAMEMLSLIDAHADKAIRDMALQIALRAAEKAYRSKATEFEQRVLDVIERAGKAVGPTELADATGKSAANICSCLKRLVDKQLIVKEGRGLYRLPPVHAPV